MTTPMEHVYPDPSPRRTRTLLRRVVLMVSFIAIAGTGFAHAQNTDDSLDAATDSSSPASDSAVTDPLRYRLLAMATGEMMPEGSAVIGVHELVVVTVNAAPWEFLQIGATVYPYEFGLDKFYWGLSARVPVYSSDGVVRGIAAGVNVGTAWPLVSERFKEGVPSYMLAGTFGSDDVQFHATLNGAVGTRDENATPLRPLQLGGTIRTGATGTLLVETWLAGGGDDDFKPRAWIAGWRSFGSSVVWEVGAMLLPDLNLNPDGPGGSIPLPYAGVSYCF